MAARSLSLREKRLIQGAVLLAIIVLVSLLLRGGGSAAPTAGSVAAPATPDRPATYAGTPPPALPVAPAQPAPAADLSQLKLYGLLASGAVVGNANGGQRLVPVGREALPGLVLVRVEQSHAVFQSAGGEIRLGFDGIAQAGDPSSGAAPPQPVATGAGAQREEVLRYRLGLVPRMANGQVAGYTVRANVELPALARAGIQPGDVILAVNGAPFGEDQLQALPRIVAGPARFDVERGGQRLQLSLRPR